VSGQAAVIGRARPSTRGVPTLARIAMAVALLSSAPARAWLCSPEDTPDAEVRRAALFSQFKDNYFISGLPWGATSTDPRHFVRFQFSIKFNLIPTRSRCTLFFAFTQKSLWKLWTESPAFEDSNFNPAFFFAWRDHDFTSQLPWQPSGFRLLGVFAGYEHESNGRGAPDSRGWDRASAFARVGYYFGERFAGGGWHVIAQPKAWYPFVPADVPQDLVDFLGYGELSLELSQEGIAYDPGEAPDGPHYIYRNFSLGALARAGKKFDRGYLEAWLRFRPLQRPQVSWSLYFQFATGFGEDLARYNEKLPPTLRVGIALDDRISTDGAARQP
jgi:outer membrane phospholipase A